MKHLRFVITILLVLAVGPNLPGCSSSGSTRMGGTNAFGSGIGAEFVVRWGPGEHVLPEGSTYVTHAELLGALIVIYKAPNGDKYICTPSSEIPYNRFVTSVEVCPLPTDQVSGGTPLPTPSGRAGIRRAIADAGMRPERAWEIPIVGDHTFSVDDELDQAMLSWTLPPGAVFADGAVEAFGVQETFEDDNGRTKVSWSGTVNAVLGAATLQNITSLTTQTPGVGEVRITLHAALAMAAVTVDGEPSPYRPLIPIHGG